MEKDARRARAAGLLLTTLAGAAAMTSCENPLGIPARYAPANVPASSAPLSKDVLLIADNQMNWLYGDPVLLRTDVADRFVSVAIRAPQLDLYGDELLRWGLSGQHQPPIIHLGDAANTSCVAELSRVFSILDASKRPWVLAPGNHDGFFDGNAHLISTSFANLNMNRKDWEAACRGADGPLAKDAFVERYVKAQQRQTPDFAAAFPKGLPEKDEWKATAGAKSLLRRIHWHVDRVEPWRSFVLQAVDLTHDENRAGTPVVGIVLDTSQYAKAPTVIPSPTSPNAGLTGSMLDDQIEVLQSWIEQDFGSHYVFLFGHHPYREQTVAARQAIDTIREKVVVPAYVSAHTHDGGYIVNPGPKRTTWLEVNVGSILDWPPEMRDLGLSCVTESKDCSSTSWSSNQIALRSRLYRLQDNLNPDGDFPAPDCDESWEARQDEPDYYLTYKDFSLNPDRTQVELLDVVIHSLIRLIRTAPTKCPAGGSTCDEDAIAAAKRALAGPKEAADAMDRRREAAQRLEKYERERALDEESTSLRQRFRFCQAYWASKYELRGARVPDDADWMIVMPKDNR